MQSVRSIDEIFKGKEHLLETHEIEEVMVALKTQWANLNEARIKSRDRMSQIEKVSFESEFFVVGGVPYDETIHRIMNVLGDD